MSNVIRLSENEIKRIEKIKALYTTLEELNKHERALMGLGDYVVYYDLDDIHDLLNMILHDASIAIQERIENVSHVNNILMEDQKKKS